MANDFETSALDLVKASLGYKSNVRDDLLNKIIAGVKNELIDEKGIKLDEENTTHLMFVVDLSVFRYENKGAGAMSRNLEYRLRNLIIKYGGGSDE
ncbi:MULTISPECIES: hypothetical protein [unclassified Enterococcus]|uniref:hypothetical protein n=1 Tax=unclassified Enterococcus TaxID=2608891 RepID=UPI0015543F2D|nr:MULTISPECIES: hypothetical protein [unclassified Enterococcus]MBS7578453.1 hypothetical protein [Enterococcus sp. MMGLQ5-2]MBS7585682.1 hypothetical protein [Enterococcus sp. MMGLQ5-1]NPD13541.1 hypothetical protein [Enterococcus sp. MMGLQ5-1]NPD38285.1 hypothetical protein [Enterococcus sp. MMGLQ5-2]